MRYPRSVVALPFLVTSLAAEEPKSEGGCSRPPGIRVEGVPEVPRQLCEAIRRYQEVREASFQDWRPGGGMLVSSRIGNISQLYLVDEPGKTPVPLTAGTEPVDDGRYLPDGRLLFSRGRGGDENFQIFIAASPGGVDRMLTDGKSRNVLGPSDREGRRVSFTSTRRNGRDSDLYLADVSREGPPEILLEVEDETWRIEDWSGDGKSALLERYVSANESGAFIMDVDARTRSPLPPEIMPLAGAVRRDALRFGPDSRSVYVATDARGEFRELARLDLAAGKWVWLAPDLAGDVEDIRIAPDGKLAAFTVNFEGLSRLFLLDLAAIEGAADPALQARAARQEVPLARAIVSGMRFSADSKVLGFTMTSASSPSEAHALDVRTGRVTRWTFSERAGLKDADFVDPEPFKYPSFDGREIPAFLYVPRLARLSPGRKFPVIVSIHGGPESQHRPLFNALRQYEVAGLEAFVIAPNVRGSTGYGKTYALLDNGVLREDSVRDIGALLDWIARNPQLDASRVAVVGGSYGGYMVLASLVHFGARIRAGVDLVGVSNFITFLENTSPYRRRLRRVEYGDERDPAIRRFFEKVSPGNRIQEIRSALLVIHGANDPRVPLSETQQIVARARESGSPVWTLYAENEGHGFRRRENTDYTEAVTADFLRRFILEGGEPAPASPPSPPAAATSWKDPLELDPGAGPVLHRRAIELFQLKEFRRAVADFDRAIERGGRTHSLDSCWERGLALYYAGDPAGARKQFEGYHRADNLDIENGLWRFICMAAEDGAAKARENLLPYAERRRRPFPALLDLYSGKGSIDAVLAEASDGGAVGAGLNEALFYAHLYIAKYLETAGDRNAARAHIEKALAHPVDHLMYACARIERDRLR
jgi:dipeptidyl aminopeptidase/acylaminoacyl peptidase